MNNLLLFTVLLLLGVLPISLYGQQAERPVHLSFEVGTSAYTFMDGRGMHIDFRWWDVLRQKPPMPLLTATIEYRRHSISVSYDEFQHCYICPYYQTVDGRTRLKPEADRDFLTGFIQWRSFKGTTMTYGYDLVNTKRLSLSPRIGVYRRQSLSEEGGERFIEKYVQKIGYPEGYYRIFYKVIDYDHLTPTLQLFARYTLFNHLTLSVKADYSRFGDGPRNQLGIGALIGYRW